MVTNSSGTRGGGFTVVDCCPKGKSRANGAGWFLGHSLPTSVGLITTGGWWCWHIQCKGLRSASKHLDVSHPPRGWGWGCAPVTPSQGFVPMGTVHGLEKKQQHTLPGTRSGWRGTQATLWHPPTASIDNSQKRQTLPHHSTGHLEAVESWARFVQYAHGRDLKPSVAFI